MSVVCGARASIASSYSHRPTTLRAMYSNTSATPSPVLADVKNNFVPHSGAPGIGTVCTGDGVVQVVAVFASRTNRLGVMVCASEKVDAIDGFRCGERMGEWLGEREDSGVERADGGVGEERAVSNASKNDDEGVW